MRRLVVSLVSLAVVAAPAVVVTSVASAAPSVVSSSVHKCRTTQLSVAAGETDGAAGTIYNVWIFTNRSSRTCSLRGYPNLQRYDTGGRRFPTIERKQLQPGRSTVTLAPGGKASFLWSYTDVPTGSATTCTQSRVMAVRPPGRSGALYIPATVPNCSKYIRISAVARGVITP